MSFSKLKVILSCGTQKVRQLLKYLSILINKFCLGNYDAGKQVCALWRLGQICMDCFLTTNEVDCKSKGCKWMVDVEDDSHLCYFQPSP